MRTLFFFGTCDFEGAPVEDSIFFLGTCDFEGAPVGDSIFFGTCDFEGAPVKKFILYKNPPLGFLMLFVMCLLILQKSSQNSEHFPHWGQL